MRAAYTALLRLALPLILLRLWWRGRREPRYREAIGERFGRYRTSAKAGVIWIHAVSVGEARAAAPLVKALLGRERGYDVSVFDNEQRARIWLNYGAG